MQLATTTSYKTQKWQLQMEVKIPQQKKCNFKALHLASQSATWSAEQGFQ